MATDTERLVVQLEARVRDFEKNFEKANRTAQRQFGSIERRSAQSTRRLQTQWATAGSAITRGLGVLGVGVGFAGVQRLLNDLDEVGKQAKRTGVDVESLQALIFGAGLAGADQAVMVKALEQLNVKIGEAAFKANDLSRLLEANGVPLRDANGELRSTTEFYLEIANLVARAGSAQDRALIVQKAMSEEASKLIPHLQQGADGLRDQENAAHDAGVVIDREIIAKAEAFNDAWATAWAQFRAGAVNAVGEASSLIDTLLAKRQAAGEWLDGLLGGPDTAATAARMYEQLRAQADPGGLPGKADREPWSPDPIKPTVLPPTKTGSGGGGGGASEQERLDRITDALARRTEALRLEAESMGLSAYEAERRRVALELEHSMQSAGIPITEQTRQKIDELSAAYARAAVSLEEASQKQDAYNEKLRQSQQAGQDVARALAEFGGDVVKDFDSAGEAVNRLLARITDLIVELLVVKPLMNALAPAGGGGILGSLFGGFLANGGPASPGKAYMVGERGPEMFMPKSAGVVIPNGQLGGGGQTQNVVINAPVTVNTNGGEPSQNRDLANQVGKAVEGQVRGLVARELRVQMRPGNMLSR